MFLKASERQRDGLSFSAIRKARQRERKAGSERNRKGEGGMKGRGQGSWDC